MATEENIPAPRTRSRESRDAREDGRRQLLVYLDPELIDRIKQATIDDGRYTYEIVEEVLWNNIKEIERKAADAATARLKRQREIRNDREARNKGR